MFGRTSTSRYNYIKDGTRMNDVTVFIFGIGFAATVGATFAFMWKSMSIVQDELKKPTRKPRHPEMEDVENGDELLVFRVDDDTKHRNP